MYHLEVSAAVRHVYMSLGFKRLILNFDRPPFCTTSITPYLADVKLCINITESGLGIGRNMQYTYEACPESKDTSRVGR